MEKQNLFRDIDAMEMEIDKAFHRLNEDPQYTSVGKIAEAISDNPRFFPIDRKLELAEILFSILDIMYELADENANGMLNPLNSNASIQHIPDYKMFLINVMPLSWGISACWPFPEMAKTKDAYIATFSEKEIAIVYQVLSFLFELFPAKELYDKRMLDDVLNYWKSLAENPEKYHLETEEEKSRMLPVLLEAAKKHNLF